MVSTHSYDGVVFNFESAKFGFKLNTDLFVISGQINPSQPVDQVTEFKFESNFKPLPVIRQSLHKPGPKAIPTDNLDCKINGLALRARSCCRPNLKQHPLFSSIFQSFICLRVKIGNRNKFSCSKFIPGQSSRFKLTSCKDFFSSLPL